MPAARACRASASRSPASPDKRRQQVDAGKCANASRHRDPLGRGAADRRCARGSENVADAGSLRRQRQQRGAIVDQRVIGLVGAIPFEHGEFGMMQRARARDCGTRGRTRRSCRSPGRQQLLAGEFRRGVQIERLARRPPASPIRSRRHADGPRCRARPAGCRPRPRQSPGRQNTAAGPRSAGPAPAATAAGRRGCAASHQGEPSAINIASEPAE